MSFDSRWPVLRTGDVFDLINGYAFKSKEFLDQGTPVLKIKNVKAGTLNLDNLAFVDREFLSIKPDKVVHKDDLLITMSGNRHDGSMETWVGKVCWFGVNEPYLVNQRVGILRLKPAMDANPRFLAYQLSSESLQKHFIAVATSSGGQANLSPTQINSTELLLPPRDVQDWIVSVAGRLEDKIQLNYQINQTLEQMAQAIFKSWFVDFEPVKAKIAILEAGLPAPCEGVFYTYAVECDDGSLYIGQTDHLGRCWREHARGQGAPWTKACPPIRVVHFEERNSRESAVTKEKEWKTPSGRRDLKNLIASGAARQAGGSEEDALLAAMQAISGKDKEQLTRFQTEQPEQYAELRATAELFPSAMQESELGEIPVGWGVGRLHDLLHFNPRRSLKKGTIAPCLDMRNVPTSGHLADEVVDREMGSGTKFINGDTLLARITPCLENGKTAFVDFLDEGQIGWGSTEYIVIRPKDDYPESLGYLMARNVEFRQYAIQSMTGTSGRQRANAKALEELPWVIYPMEVVYAFDKLAGGYLKLAKSYGDESKSLSQVRDTLLPKLLSGELTAPDVESQLAEAEETANI